MNYYIDYFCELINSHSIFWFCALAGSSVFFIQFIFNLFGITDQDNFDSCETFSNTLHETTDTRIFKWLSVQTITGFLMMFGWTAITCQSEFGLQIMTTLAISLAAGISTALIIRSIVKITLKLKSSGSTYNIEEAIGQEAYVYHRIPKGGIGKISMTLQHFTHEIDAISDHSEDLPSFMRVKVIKKFDSNTVVVTPL